MERQAHGFSYQKDVIKRFGLVAEEKYVGKLDAYCDGIPVSIKKIHLMVKMQNWRIFLDK